MEKTKISLNFNQFYSKKSPKKNKINLNEPVDIYVSKLSGTWI